MAQMLRDALHFDTKELQGTGSFGLGLILSHGYLIAHGGELWMKSQGVGKGRTVAFGLPLTKQSNALQENKGTSFLAENKGGVGLLITLHTIPYRILLNASLSPSQLTLNSPPTHYQHTLNTPFTSLVPH